MAEVQNHQGFGQVANDVSSIMDIKVEELTDKSEIDALLPAAA